MSARYRVRIRAGNCPSLRYAIERPDGVVVWFAAHLGNACDIAARFADRAALHASLVAHGRAGEAPQADYVGEEVHHAEPTG